MSCSSACTSSSSRSSKLELRRKPVGRGLRGDGVQPEALGREVPAGVRSKKSKTAVRAASASTPSGREHLDRLGDARDLALLAARLRLAMRSTAMTSATSDSTAATTSPTEAWSSRTTRSTRLRDSASAGKASRASNAAVRRRPCPSLCRRSLPAAAWGLVVRRGCHSSCLASVRPCVASRAAYRPTWTYGRSSWSAEPAILGPSGPDLPSAASMRCERLLAAQNRQRLEDPG